MPCTETCCIAAFTTPSSPVVIVLEVIGAAIACCIGCGCCDGCDQFCVNECCITRDTPSGEIPVVHQPSVITSPLTAPSVLNSSTSSPILLHQLVDAVRSNRRREIDKGVYL